MEILLLVFILTIWALWAMRNQNKLHYVVLLVLFTALIVTGYENGRAGMVADETGVSGCAVGLLGCWGVPVMFGLAGVVLVYEILLIRRYYRLRRGK